VRAKQSAVTVLQATATDSISKLAKYLADVGLNLAPLIAADNMGQLLPMADGNAFFQISEPFYSLQGDTMLVEIIGSVAGELVSYGRGNVSTVDTLSLPYVPA
jgi:hypothetical protein